MVSQLNIDRKQIKIYMFHFCSSLIDFEADYL